MISKDRRTEVEQLYRLVGELHSHDVEDECCTPTCEAWAFTNFCISCGERRHAQARRRALPTTENGEE